MDTQSKKIEISKASLLGLKAELLRKQEEAKQTKLNATFVDKSICKKKKTKKSSKKESSAPAVVDVELLEQLRKSRKVLEAKSKIYDDLSKPGASTQTSEEVFLVNFTEKQNETVEALNEIERLKIAEEKKDGSRLYDPEIDIEEFSEDEVDYVDYFGRTNTVARRDLSNLIEQDKRLSRSFRLFPSDKVWDDIDKVGVDTDNVSRASEPVTRESELLSGDMKRELLRKEWEAQEAIITTKNVVHYQDILFNEARFHGVAYYSFSSDDKVRAQQHAALDEIRAETIKAQKVRSEKRALREKMVKSRVRAAKNRIRARMGLSPLPEINEEEASKMEEEDEQKRLLAAKEKEEQEKEQMRAQHLRPWDEGKEHLPVFTEMSQEQWVDRKRSERPDEFAPPSLLKEPRGSRTFDGTGYFYDATASYAHNLENPPPSTADLVEAKLKSLRAQVEISSEIVQENVEATKGLYFSSRNKNQNIKRNKEMYEQNQADAIFVPTPIRNELSSDSSESEWEQDDQHGENKSKRKRAEIPPPLSFEYFGPASGAGKRAKVDKKDLEDAFSAGMKYLQESKDKKGKNKNTQYFEA